MARDNAALLNEMDTIEEKCDKVRRNRHVRFPEEQVIKVPVWVAERLTSIAREHV